ncbi:MAG: carbohydrate ABC transporter permease [Proteobacteria bacterium]|nr:carbohydrate ABC transporter permease [Pseudomonadota bacterium]MBI3495762.1 carbohydrate ABC transporter permease [Pseudomonadota bacterium]
MAPETAQRLNTALAVLHWRNLMVTLPLCAGGVLMLLPFLWMFSASLRPVGEAYRLPPTLLPDIWDATSYQQVLESGLPFLSMYWNSFVVAALTTLGVLLTASMAAFAFARLRFSGSRALFALMFVGLMVPPALVLIPIYVGFAALHLLDTRAALILPALASSFGVYMMRQFMLGLPRELEEAAKIDGAGYWTIYRRISLPQLGPALAALGIITFTASWNNFIAPFVLIKSLEQMTLPIGVVALQGVFGPASLSVLMAATVMAILPLFVVFLVAQRFIIEGLTMTGIKG